MENYLRTAAGGPEALDGISTPSWTSVDYFLEGKMTLFYRFNIFRASLDAGKNCLLISPCYWGVF